MTTIKAITEIADRGYINDPEMVKAVIDELVNLPIKEIFGCVSGDRTDSFRMLEVFYDINEEAFDNITFLELLCLIDNMHREEYTDFSKKTNEYSAAELKMFYADMLSGLLIEAGARNELIRLVLGLSITAMSDYLNSRYDDRTAYAVYRRIFSRACDVRKSCMKMNCTTVMNLDPHKWMAGSIGEILKDINHACSTPWRPWWSVNDYRMVQLALRSIEADILIAGFREGFREKMKIEEVIRSINPCPGSGDDWPDFARLETEMVGADLKKEV